MGRYGWRRQRRGSAVLVRQASLLGSGAAAESRTSASLVGFLLPERTPMPAPLCRILRVFRSQALHVHRVPVATRAHPKSVVHPQQRGRLHRSGQAAVAIAASTSLSLSLIHI